MREIAIPKGTLVNVGILASNRNPDIWGPDADEWKPERWLTPLPDSVAAAHLPGIYSNLSVFRTFSSIHMRILNASAQLDFSWRWQVLHVSAQARTYASSTNLM